MSRKLNTAMEWPKKNAPIKQLVLSINDDSDKTIETVQYNCTDWPNGSVPVELIMNEEHTNLKPTQTIVAIRVLTEEVGAIFAHPLLTTEALKEVLENMDEFAPLVKTPTYVVVNAEAVKS